MPSLRFLRQTALPGAFALGLAACATSPAPPRTWTEVHYDCGETLETPDGRFSAERYGVGWSRDLGDGMSLGGSLRLIGDEEVAGFAATGFAGHRFVLFAGFADRFDVLGERAWSQGRPTGTASMFRIGRSVATGWVPVNMVHAIEWSRLQEMMREPGDLEVALYDASGTIHQRAMIARDVLLRIEPTLLSLHARVLEKERDHERLCRREEVEVGPPIILTH